MPTFEFQCEKCKMNFARQLPFGTKQLPPCPECDGLVRKLIRPPAIHFKGSGFYKTDSSKSSPPVKQKTEADKTAAPEQPAEKKTENKPETPKANTENKK